MSILAMVKSKGPNGFGYGSTAEEVTDGIDLGGKTILVTGCNSGLGNETMRVLAKRGAQIVGLARTKDSAAAALSAASAKGTPVACDLSEPASVRAAVAEVKKAATLDAMILNAGVMALPTRQVKHGLEMQFLTNHVGHFLLATGLVDRLAPDGRVVVLSSGAHHSAPPEGIRFDDLDASKSYAPWTNYGQSKLANALFARVLAKRLAGSKRVANALHPGVIRTNLGRHMGIGPKLALGIAGPLFLKSIPQGAATQCYVAAHRGASTITGEYFSDCNVARPSRNAQDDTLADKLWSKTEELVAKI
jgi:NAD(P)-dependent dehydrogenase (short-subunit alcohol dehydrogenase family)